MSQEEYNTQHAKGKHLTRDDMVLIGNRFKDGWKANRIAKEIGCSANTIRNVIQKGTVALYHGKVQRYKVETAYRTYQENRSHSHRKTKILEAAAFLRYLLKHFAENGWSLDGPSPPSPRRLTARNSITAKENFKKLLSSTCEFGNTQSQQRTGGQENEPILPAITVSPDGGRGAYDRCSIYEIQNDRKEALREINICAEYIDRPIAEVTGTIPHEMAHLYNLVHGLKDVSNNGYYHNKQFKATAEAHGLIISKHDKYGWTTTQLAQETAEWLATVPGMEDITVSRKMLMQAKATADDSEEDDEQEAPKRPTRTVTKKRSIKYVCPECGTIIRATKVVNVLCGECMVAFIPEIK